MTIKKNTAAAEEAAKAAAKAPAAKAVKPKAEPKAEPKAKAPAAPVEAPEAPAEKAEKVGRKEVAAIVRDHVFAAGAAIPPKVAELAVQGVEEALTVLMASGKQVALPGFGIFQAVHRAESNRPNPQKKGETITVPAHFAPKFKPGAKLKAAMNGGAEVGEE